MTPVGVFFICQNEDKCHFVNSTILSHSQKSKNQANPAKKHFRPGGI